MATHVYVTKYCLSKGEISLKEVTKVHDFVSVKGVSLAGEAWGIYYVGRDCFESLDDALAKAELMRRRKIESLNKSIQRLAGLSFTETSAISKARA